MKNIEELFEDAYKEHSKDYSESLIKLDRQGDWIMKLWFKKGYDTAKSEYDVVMYDLKHNTTEEKDAYFEILKKDYSEEFAYFMKGKFVMLHPGVREFAFHLWAETKQCTKYEYEERLKEAEAIMTILYDPRSEGLEYEDYEKVTKYFKKWSEGK